MAATEDRRDGFGKLADRSRRQWTREELEYTIRFDHPEKLIAHFPIASEVPDDLLAAIFQVSVGEFRTLRQRHRDAVAHAAEEIGSDDRCRRLLEALPVHSGDVVVAYGDSITDDYQSWAYILERLLDAVRPRDKIRVINAGVSGATSSDLLLRFARVAALKPSWLLVMVGTNDAIRPFGGEGTFVSLGETRRNLRTIASLAANTTAADLIWLTPPPVLPEQFARHWVARIEPIALSEAATEDTVAAVLSRPETVVDTRPAFGAPPSPEFFVDGVHPSLAGQREIVARLLEAWVSSSARNRAAPAGAQPRRAPG